MRRRSPCRLRDRPHHPETRAEYYSTTRDVITCDKCAIIGGHRGDICELATIAATSCAVAWRVQAAHREHEQAIAAAHASIDATYNGLKTRIDEKARVVIEGVKKQSALAKEKLRQEQLAKKEAASASIHALNTLDTEVKGKLAALPRLDGQAAAVREAEQGLQIFQAPKWGKEQADEAFRRFEALEPFKAIEEAAFKAKPEFQIFVRNCATTRLRQDDHGRRDGRYDGRGAKGILAENTGVPQYCQGIIFWGTVLEDAQTMAHYNIGREDTVEMRLFARELSARGKLAKAVQRGRGPKANRIYVKPLTGETMTLDVTPLDTVWDVKLKLHAQMGIHEDVAVLIYAGKVLPDKSTLAECAVFDQSTLHLIVGSGQIHAALE